MLGTIALFTGINAAYLLYIARLKSENNGLRGQAFYDNLTGLANRCLFMDRLSLKVSHAKRYNEKVGVIFLDLDGFKAVNDTHGHEAGDIVLKVVAERIASCTRNSDTVARFGGDEFAIILPESQTVEDIIFVAERIISTVNDPIEFKGQNITVGTSIGICMHPVNGSTPKELVKAADAAMYNAKSCGKNSYRLAPGLPVSK